MQPNTPAIITPPTSRPRRVVVAEIMSPVSSRQQQQQQQHNINSNSSADDRGHDADDDDDDNNDSGAAGGVGDDNTVTDHERSVITDGGGGGGGDSSGKRMSPILSPRETFQSPYAYRSRPRRTPSNVSQGADQGGASRGGLSAVSATEAATSAPQRHHPRHHHHQHHQQQSQTQPACSPGSAAASTAADSATAELIAQLEQARAEIKRKDQAIAARDSKLAEAWLKLERAADPLAAAARPGHLDAATGVAAVTSAEGGKAKRRRYKWMPSLGWKSKNGAKFAHTAAAAATAATASPPQPAGVQTAAAADGSGCATLAPGQLLTELEDDDGLTWDTTEMVRYDTPTNAVVGAAAVGGVGDRNISLSRSEAARSFSPVENSRLSVVGPSTSIMQRAIDEAEAHDAERKVREEQATALVEKKAAERMAARVRRTAAAAPEFGRPSFPTGAAAAVSPASTAVTDIETLADLVARGGNAAASTTDSCAAAAAAATRRGASVQSTKFVPTQQSKKQARKSAAEQRKTHKQIQKLQKKQMKESARWAKEQAQNQKREAKKRAKEAKVARAQHKKANAAVKETEAEFEAAVFAAAAGPSSDSIDRTGFSGTGVEDMWENDVAWKQEVEYLQKEDPQMLQEELEARNASIHERSRSGSRASSFRVADCATATSHAAAAAAAGERFALPFPEGADAVSVNRSMSMAAAPVARSKSKRFQWGLSFLRRSKSMRTSKAGPTAAAAPSVLGVAAEAKPKRRWSLKPKFSFLRRKRTGNAATIAARAEDAAKKAAGSLATAHLQQQGRHSYGVSAEDPSMITDLDSLWLSLNPQADATSRADTTDV